MIGNFNRTRHISKAILFTKTNSAQTEDALSYYRAHGLYFLAVVFATTKMRVLLRADNTVYRKYSRTNSSWKNAR